MTRKAVLTPEQVEDRLADLSRSVRILRSEILNFEALLSRKILPLENMLKEHEEALELIADVLPTAD